MIYIWLIMTLPYRFLICSMWVRVPPTEADMVQACGTSQFKDPNDIWQAVDWQTGYVPCKFPASELPNMSQCDWPQSMDHYQIQVVDTAKQEQICLITIDHPGDPTEQDLDSLCPKALGIQYDMKLETYGQAATPQVAEVICPMPAPSSKETLASLHSSDALNILDLQLRITYGQDGLSPQWQNQFDQSILDASNQTGVPAHILKGVIRVESQFWPLWRNAGEAGLIDLTDEGADTTLRLNKDLYDQFCPYASWDCSTPYDLQPAYIQAEIRSAFIQSLILMGPTINAVKQAEDDMVIYAQILAAYYCQASGGPVPGWDGALASFRAGWSCIQTGVICDAGQEYISEVKP